MVAAPHSRSQTGANALVVGARAATRAAPTVITAECSPPHRYWLKTSLRKRAIATLYSRSARSSAGLLGLVKAWVVPL